MFNQTYPVGSIFVRQGEYVATVDKANKFESGVIVEINKIPWFVKIETLWPVDIQQKTD